MRSAPHSVPSACSATMRVSPCPPLRDRHASAMSCSKLPSSACHPATRSAPGSSAPAAATASSTACVSSSGTSASSSAAVLSSPADACRKSGPIAPSACAEPPSHRLPAAAAAAARAAATWNARPTTSGSVPLSGDQARRGASAGANVCPMAAALCASAPCLELTACTSSPRISRDAAHASASEGSRSSAMKEPSRPARSMAAAASLEDTATWLARPSTRSRTSAVALSSARLSSRPALLPEDSISRPAGLAEATCTSTRSAAAATPVSGSASISTTASSSPPCRRLLSVAPSISTPSRRMRYSADLSAATP
mmetsp:Transcript_44866/g.113573  ORF Transcript_44866/g.113573 Transcript_44866/m.113573 type:complete len:312 (-) Transcript_44866:404-1339(-)